MNRIKKLLQQSIINKVILLVSLILLAVGGILIVNITSFFDVKDSLISMVDRDVAQVIENLRLQQNLSNLYAHSDMLIATFTERKNTLQDEKNQILTEIRRNIKALKLDESVSQTTFEEHTKQLNRLFENAYP